MERKMDPASRRRRAGIRRVHFRKTFTLATAPTQFVIHVSGDNRYELFVNGQRVATGPARGDLKHWRYETLDIAPKLQAGKNVLAAVVWNYAELAPMAQEMNETGFIVQGDGADEAMANTDDSWKSCKDEGVQAISYTSRGDLGYFVVGPGERVDASRYPWGWEKPDYDDSAWVDRGNRRPCRAARSAGLPFALVPDSPHHSSDGRNPGAPGAPGAFPGC